VLPQVVFASGGKVLVSGSRDRMIRLLKVPSLETVSILSLH
jgi:WD40 repeat protein